MVADHGTESANHGERPAWTLRRPSLAPVPHEDAVRVLAIDGGGVRGIIPTIFLRELEARTGKRTIELFDFVSGTSTGAIIALGLSVPGNGGRPKWSADDAVRFYEEQGPRIFRRTRTDALRNLGVVLHEKFHSEPLEEALEVVFGDTTLSESLVDVLVPAYDMTHREVYFFTRRHAREEPPHDVPMKVVARAATAAPTFFEPLLVDLKLAPPPVFVDGGLFANNPAMCAFAEVEQQRLGADIVIASVGTGANDLEQQWRWDEIRDWGLAHWVRPLMQILHDAGSQAVDFQLRELLGAERYHRFQAPGVRESMDDGRVDAITRLREHGEAMVSRHDREIDDLCRLLVR